jgi:hypothetical protein
MTRSASIGGTKTMARCGTTLPTTIRPIPPNFLGWRHPDRISGLAVTESREQMIDVVDIRADEILEPRVAVKSPSVAADLHDPRPDSLRRGVHRQRAHRPCEWSHDEFVPGATAA